MFKYATRTIGSDAGKVSITAAEGVVLDGTFSAKAGSPSNQGGRLDVTLDRNKRNEGVAAYPTNALTIDVVQQDQKILPAGFNFGDDIPTGLNGQAIISSEEIAQAGFDDLRLTSPFHIQKEINDVENFQLPPNEIRFIGDVDLTAANSIYLDAQTIRSGYLDGSSAGICQSQYKIFANRFYVNG